MEYLIFTILNFLLIIFLIFFLKKKNLLLDNPKINDHKLFYTKNTPLAGGIFFYINFLLLLSIYQTNYIELNIVLFSSYILILGIFSDIKKNFHPSKRLILQVIFVLFIVFFFDIKIQETRIEFLDLLLNNLIFQIFFTSFCILTVLNGFNFLDGFNGITTGYFLICFVIFYFLSLIIGNQADIMFFKLLVIPFFIFYLFNIFGKVFLGDNGIYLLSLLLSLIVIKFLGKNNEVSPIFAMNIFWYPAFANLFSILRRFKEKNKLMNPDRKHLHTMINIFIKKKLVNSSLIKYNNSLTGLIINVFLLPSFIFALINYNKSLILGFIVLINVSIYLLIYWSLKDLTEDNS